MAKTKGAGKLHPLPFTTFGEITALGFKATVYCSPCYEHRSIDPAAEHLRDRCFATTRFRCIKIRYTGAVCGSPGSVEIEPFLLLPVGGEDTLAFLSCGTCLPPWEISADRQAAVVGGEPRRQRPLQVPGVREGRGLAYPRADLAADLRCGGYFNRCRPASVRLTECRPPEMMSQPRSIA
jgi:hypothetical protein